MAPTFVDGHGRRRCQVSGKVCFAARAEAEAIRVDTGRESRLYRCRYCGEIHWGSAPRRPGINPGRRRRAGRR